MNTINELGIIFITSIITGLAAYSVTFMQNNKDIVKIRLDKFISPAFELLDEYYKSKINESKTQNVVNELIEKAKEYTYLTGGKIKLAIYKYQKCSNDEKQEAFEMLCKLISQEYDEACLLLGIPIRTSEYRRIKGQPSYWKPMFFKSAKVFLIIMFLVLYIAILIAFVQILI